MDCNSCCRNRYVKLFVRDNVKVLCQFRGPKIFSGSISSESLHSILCKNTDLHLLTFIGEYGCFTAPRRVLIARATSTCIRDSDRRDSIMYLTTKQYFHTDL